MKNSGKTKRVVRNINQKQPPWSFPDGTPKYNEAVQLVDDDGSSVTFIWTGKMLQPIDARQVRKPINQQTKGR